uniref:Uncharacterized protein n=1 Tax=Arundo donax TaxID=35708 RepID=A0A0A9HMD6_ARUDO
MRPERRRVAAAARA